MCKQLTICWIHQTGNYNYHGETQSIYVHFELPQFRYNWIPFLFHFFSFSLSVYVCALRTRCSLAYSLVYSLQSRSFFCCLNMFGVLFVGQSIFLLFFFVVVHSSIGECILVSAFFCAKYPFIYMHTRTHLYLLNSFDWMGPVGWLVGWSVGWLVANNANPINSSSILFVESLCTHIMRFSTFKLASWTRTHIRTSTNNAHTKYLLYICTHMWACNIWADARVHNQWKFGRMILAMLNANNANASTIEGERIW